MVAQSAFVSTDPLPSKAVVTAKTDGTIFTVTSIAALALEWVAVDPGELLGGSPRHAGKPIRTQQWVEVASSDGSTPLTVLQGQKLLVQMTGTAPAAPTQDAAPIRENLNVTVNGVPGGSVSTEIRLEVGEVEAVPDPPIINPRPVNSSGQFINYKVTWISGPPVFASFLGIDTFDSTVGLKISSGPQPSVTGPVSQGSDGHIFVAFGPDPNSAQKGATGFYMWMSLSTEAGGQMIRIVPIPAIIV